MEMHTVLAALEGLLLQAISTSAYDDALAGEDDAMLAAVEEAKRVLIGTRGELSQAVTLAEERRG